jgi:hypothetical protein
MMKYNFQLSNMHLAMVHKFKLIFYPSSRHYGTFQRGYTRMVFQKKPKKRFGTLVIVAKVLEGMKLWSMARRGSALLQGALHALSCRANGIETPVRVGPTSQITHFCFCFAKRLLQSISVG